MTQTPDTQAEPSKEALDALLAEIEAAPLRELPEPASVVAFPHPFI